MNRHSTPVDQGRLKPTRRVRGSLSQGRIFGALVLVFAAGFAAPALAHHSAAAFDATKKVVYSGTVKQFLWTNPHSLLVLSVRNSDGVVQDYSFEANGPGYLVRNGWVRESLKPGDKITVVSNPLFDGRPGGNLVEVTLADGRKLSAAPQLAVEGAKQ